MNAEQKKVRIPIAFPPHAAEPVAVTSGAMAAARIAQTRWAKTPVRQRLRALRELRSLIARHAGALAEASASARARPAVEALTAEVLPLAEACRFLERNAERLLAPEHHGWRDRPLWLTGVRGEIHREPLGVVLIIGPGNYPLLLPGVQMLQAVVAGNAVWLKPGIGGTAAASVLHVLMIRAGIPAELVTVLSESTEAARAAIAAGPDKVLFTGSAAIGEEILAQLAPGLTPSVMELSGCDAVIVRADADLDLTAKALAFGLQLNNGATCMAPRRVFVAQSIATELEGRLARVFNSSTRHIRERDSRKQRAGACPGEPAIISPAAAQRLRPLLDEALLHGAHFIAGRISLDGSITAPVVIAGVSPRARLLREDVFLPVLCFVTVADDDEAVLRTNECPYALGASIFSVNETAARVLAARIHAGVVTINDLIVPTADARLPFGGCNRSGFGVTRGADGLRELTRPKVVTISRGRFRPALEKGHLDDAKVFDSYLQLTHARGLKVRWSALVKLIRTLLTRQTISPANNT
jgi:acyl-CoA reductase-like NAD-dependent aldehyde dehydrogenase